MAQTPPVFRPIYACNQRLTSATLRLLENRLSSQNHNANGPGIAQWSNAQWGFNNCEFNDDMCHCERIAYDKMLNRDNRGSHTGCAGIIGSDCNGGGNAAYNIVATYRTDLLQYKCTAPGVSEPRNERFSRERRYAIYVKQA